GDGGPGPVARQCAARVLLGDSGLAAQCWDDLLVEVDGADELAAPGEQVLAALPGLAVGDVGLRRTDELPRLDELPSDRVDRLAERAGGLVLRDAQQAELVSV